MIAKRYMTQEMKATEIKFLKNERESLLVDLEAAIARFEAMAHRVALNKREILEIKAEAAQSPEYLEELEGKARVSYLKNIIDDATRDKRYENDELMDLKRAQGDRLFLLKEQIRIKNEELNFLQI